MNEEFDLHDQIRDRGRITMETFLTSPDLEQRIVVRTHRRARQRRQRAAAGMGAGIVALSITGFVLVNRPSDRTAIETTSASTEVPSAAPRIVVAQSTTPAASVPPTNAAPSTTLPPDRALTSTIVAVVADTSMVAATTSTAVVAAAAELTLLTTRSPAHHVRATVLSDLLPGYTTPSSTDGEIALTSFDATGNGTLLAVRPSTGAVELISASGATSRATIPPTDADGALWDAAIGPDSILYVSRRLEGAAGGDPERFTLVGYRLGDDGSATEVTRMPTAWECVETFCGTVTFEPAGISYVNPDGAPAGYAAATVASLLEQPTRSGGDTPGDTECLDDLQAGDMLMAIRERVTYRALVWELEVACTFVTEGSFTSYVPQPDGSVLALVPVRQRSSEAPRELLARFRPGGGADVFDVTGMGLIEVAAIGERIVGVTAAAGEPLRLVELTAEA